ncbi:hypothetical protein LPJ56_001533 [Coemansia sp. RSA 2599]|nr:hypothetical protein LPJ56_001533 [Coemansia sp. RSA 2599]
MDFEQTLGSLREDLYSIVRPGRRDDISWNWLATAACRVIGEHSTGVSRAILLTELESQWHALSSSEVLQTEVQRTVGPFFNRTGKPPSTTVFGLKVDNMRTIQGTQIWLWTVSGAPDPRSARPPKAGASAGRKRNTADMQTDFFVHQRYYPLIGGAEFQGFFSKTRTLLATALLMSDRGGAADGQPIHTLLPTTALAFVLRIKDDPGISDAMRKHTDEALLHDVFGVAFNGRRFVHSGMPVFDADQVWCKITQIHPAAQTTRDGRSGVCQEMECVYEQHGQQAPAVATIAFWDNDTAAVRLFKADDYIGLLCPVVCERDGGGLPIRLDYGPQTIAFVMGHVQQQPSTCLTQTDIVRNDLGYFDYGRYAHRLRIDQLRGDMSNVTLLANVLLVSENKPVADPDAEGAAIDRCAVRLVDSTDTCDVTLWGSDLGRQAARIRPGQLVLIHNLETEAGDGGLLITGGPAINTSIFNISTMPGVLTSSALRTYSFLAELPAQGCRYIKACATAVRPAASAGLSDPRDRTNATTLLHSACGRPVVLSGSAETKRLDNPVDTYLFDCLGCGRAQLPTAEVEPAFCMCVDVDDGTASRCAQVDAAAAPRIMRITPAQFLELPSRREQLAALASVLGREFVASVSLFASELEDSAATLRIDAACPAADVGVPSVE